MEAIYDMSYKPSWMNASEDIASLDKQISEKTALRKTYSDKLAIVYSQMAICDKLTGLKTCNGATGKTMNNWRDDRDRYNGLIKSLDKQIAELQTLKKDAVAGAKGTAELGTKLAEMDKANADLASANAGKYVKYVIIGVVVIGAVVGGIWFYKKKLKK